MRWWEVGDRMKSLQTTRTRVDDLRRDREDFEWMLEEAKSGTSIGGLEDALWK